MNVFSAVVTLFLVLDPLGNIPLFLSVLKTVSPERRRKVLVREIAIAYLVLLLILFLGSYALQFLHLDPEAISIAGGIVLFLIALRMIFPREATSAIDSLEGEPFVVPLAIPLFAGPSTLATILLLRQSSPSHAGLLLLAITIAWALSGSILLASTFFYRVLGESGLIAMARLMGMLLVTVAVQMLLNGLKSFLTR
ncbi:MAG TPA: MarC family protein [Candidatus Acidoferrales bacterium]|jgi:multiple antibiotic resistance protein|nr:MarC family protein [Candidatus Acidoferrales bacterium]